MIQENIKNIEQKISMVCGKIGRSREDIKIIAVSKNNDPASIIEANKCGIEDFGENKAQELKSKYTECPSDLIWHFIGHLQSNKVKDVVPIASMIHSVDSIKLAKEIEKRAKRIGKIQNILLEVNTSGETSKFGLKDYDEIFELADYCNNLSNVNLKGLMTMAPFTEDKEIIRNSFGSLKNIFRKLNDKGFQLKELSMGMTNDFELALEEGSTMVRIGTAIFGGR